MLRQTEWETGHRKSRCIWIAGPLLEYYCM